MDAREADGTQSKRNGACHYPWKLTFRVTVYVAFEFQSEKKDGRVHYAISLCEKAQEQHMYMWTLHNTVGMTF